MKLLRFAKFYFKNNIPDQWKRFDKVRFNKVIVRNLGAKDKNNGVEILVCADTTMEFAEIVNDYAIVPNKEREKCEECITFLANLISCQSWSSREIGAVLPSVLFELEDEEEKKLIEKAKGIYQEFKLLRFKPFIPLEQNEIITQFTDRKEGAALLSEALAQATTSGKYKDLVRLFENAFDRPCKQIDKKMAQFLPGKMNYTAVEIKKWFSLRDGASHGEEGRAKKLTLEKDLYSILQRMEQAALDVFFNKKNWKMFDRSRREVWCTESYSSSENLDTFQLAGSPYIEMEFIDYFGVYKLKSDIPHLISEDVPRFWWPEVAYSKENPPRIKVNIGKRR